MITEKMNLHGGKQRFGFKLKEFWKTYDNFWINILNDKHVIINDYP